MKKGISTTEERQRERMKKHAYTTNAFHPFNALDFLCFSSVSDVQDVQMPWAHGCAGTASVVKNKAVALSTQI